MDIDNILNNDGYHAPNPEYKQGNGKPKYIITDDPNYAIGSTASMFMEAAKQGDLDKIGDADTYRKYIEYGITPRQGDSLDDYQRNLANYQGFLEKARNSFIQTLSEGGLGTVKAFSDLFDLVTLQWMRNDFDYQNPVSAQLEQWQEQIKDNFTIWQDPNVNILNGGLLNSSFIFNGLPSIISSLTLLVPSKATSFLATKLITSATKKGLSFARNLSIANKENKLGKLVKNTVDKANAAVAIDNPFVSNAKNIMDYGIGGLTSRLLENYQESRQTYNDAKPVFTDIIKNMSPEEREKTINNLKQEFGEDSADWGSYDSIANLVSRKAADETFKDDMANIFFDVYQMYAIGKASRVINGPDRAALRRINKNNIKFANKTKEEIDDILAKRTKFQKFKDTTSDLIIGGKHSILSELSEGVEEAVNYIAQEEGFHYGKVLLDQEADSDFWSDRLVNYMKAPQLWDSAFWGLVGGITFNAAGEYANRTVQAIDKIKDAKKEAKNRTKEESVKIPTFREAFKDTELTVRKENLESNITKFKTAKEKLNKIQNGEDVYGITNNGVLETQEEKDASKEIAVREFRDEVLLNAMDAGNFDLAKEYLSSNELKQALVESGEVTQEQADKMQEEVLSRGDELLREYKSQLRNIYSAINGYGRYNKADLLKMPAEVLNIIARENIQHNLAYKYYEDRIGRLMQSNAELEEDSKEELEKAAKENGITDFKSIVRNVWLTQNLGVLNAEIEDVKSKNQQTTAAGQAVLRSLELRKKILEDEILKTAYDSNNTVNVEGAANALLSAKAIASVEMLPVTKGEKHIYQINEGNERYLKLKEAIANKDEKLIRELAPIMDSILKNAPKQTTGSTFLEDVISRSKVLDQSIKDIYDNKGDINILKNINNQLNENYKEIAALQVNALFEKSQLNTTREQIKSRANDIMNQIDLVRLTAIDSSTHLYQQLAKRYGKNELISEVVHYVNKGEHTPVYDKFTEEEKSAFDSYTKILKLNKPENDIVIKDITNALNHNDIYEYSKKEDVIEIIREQKRKRTEEEAQKNSTSQNSSQATQNQTVNNQSSSNVKSSTEQGTSEIEGLSPQSSLVEENEITEGVVTVSDEGTETNNANSIEEEIKSFTDERLDEEIKNNTEFLNNPSISDEVKQRINNVLTALTEEKNRRATSQISSTGEQNGQNNQELIGRSKSDVVSYIKNLVNELSENNPDNINKEELRNKVISLIKTQYSDIEDEEAAELVDTSMPIVDRRLKSEGETIESSLAKGIIRLSRISSSSTSEQIISEAKAVIDKGFNDLLDIFNKYLSNGKIDGKYIIPLESLIRYTKNITNNEFDAKEMYGTFSKIIAENPDKYVTIQGTLVNPAKFIENITATTTERIKTLTNSIGGRTLDIQTLLDSYDNKDEKKKILKVIKSLSPGTKLYVQANYNNVKEKALSSGIFIGGINIIAIDENGEKTLISKLPTPAFSEGGKTNYISMLNGWYYKFPLAEEKGKVEFNIQLFFKELFTSNEESAIKFRKALSLYESYNQKEAYDENLGGKTIKEAYAALTEFAKVAQYDLKEFVRYGTNTERGNAERIRHLAKLDYYTKEKWYLDLEDLNYNDEKIDENKKHSIIESINLWFNKLVESSDTRRNITNVLEDLQQQYDPNLELGLVYDIGVEVESIGKPKLVITKEENALPVSKGIAEQHKNDIHLGAGDLRNTSQIIVSNGQPINFGGTNTMGRTVVTILSPDGNPVYVHAYPVQMNNSVFDNNVKLAAFKEALTTKLFELMDDWYANPEQNSEYLELFLSSLGHKINPKNNKYNINTDGSLFKGFTINYLPNGNGFSIQYKTVNGKIISPDSREHGEYHYLTFYNKVPTKNGRKARAAVQHYVYGKNNPAVVWNTNPTDTSTLNSLNAIKSIITDVVINSLKVRIDPLNINADNNSQNNYGSFMTRDSNGNFALRVEGIKRPSENLKQYYSETTGDITITNLGRNGKEGNFSDFILFNDLVNVTTRPIDDSNFSIFNNMDGDFGITYAVKPITPTIVKEVIPTPTPIKLSKVVKDLLDNKKNANRNDSKAVIKAILNRIADSNSSLYQLTKDNVLIRQLLHKNIIFVENFNGATYKQGNETVTVPNDAYAAYIPSDTEFTINDKKVNIKEGDIVVGDRFMELLDGNSGDIIDALHHILHENVHALIEDNRKNNKDLYEKHRKELEELWDEYSETNPNSDFSRQNIGDDLEEFIVESLTNIDLIKDLNSIKAKNPLNNERKPKSLLGKILDKIINWLADILGNDFKINKDSLFSKEYAIFEEAIINNKNDNTKNKKKKENNKKDKKVKQKQKYVEGVLDFVPYDDEVNNNEENNNEGTDNNAESDDIDSFIANIKPSTETKKVSIKQDTRTEAPSRPKKRFSRIGMRFPTLRGALDNINSDNYFDVVDKINKGIISIKCN